MTEPKFGLQDESGSLLDNGLTGLEGADNDTIVGQLRPPPTDTNHALAATGGGSFKILVCSSK